MGELCVKVLDVGVLSSDSALKGVLLVGSTWLLVDAAFDPPTVVHVAVFHLYVFSGIGAAVGHGSVRQFWLYSGRPAWWQR